MIRRLDLVNYKAFKRFTVHFAESGYIVGPNNAGKSTLVQALRAAAQMLTQACARSPSEVTQDRSSGVLAHPIDPEHLSLVTENIRHEFIQDETRIDVTFTNDVKIHAVWPIDDEGNAQPAFFYLEDASGRQLQRPKDVREAFPQLGIIPTLMPIEADESVLSDDYVRRYADTRRASRHFRNQLRLLQRESGSEGSGYDDFVRYAESWTLS
ncbi:AAA family ATPase [Sorangium sp. So ce269]